MINEVVNVSSSNSVLLTIKDANDLSRQAFDSSRILIDNNLPRLPVLDLSQFILFIPVV